MCNKHFLHSDYKQPPGGTYVLRLKDDAVPTVCLPSSSLPPVKIHVLDEVPNILENVNESGNSESNIVTTETNVVEDNSENEIPEVTLPILITPTKAKAIPTEQVTPVRKRKSVEITTPIRNMKNKIKDNTTFKIDDVRVLMNTAIERVTSENWKNFIEHVKTEENKLTEVDKNMDEIIDSLEPCILTITGETSDSSDV